MMKKPIYFITFDLRARGGISYYARAVINGFKEQNYHIKVIELAQKNRWKRLLALLIFMVLVPRRAKILSSHVNFLRAIVPFKRIKSLSIAAIIYNTEMLHPTVKPILPKIDYFFPLFSSGQRRLKLSGIEAENLSLVTNILLPSKPQKRSIHTSHPLLVISRLDTFDIKNKGLFYLLRALRYDQNINLIIAGSGDAKISLEAYCKKYQIEKQVIFKGYISDAEKIELMRSAAAFIHLSSGEGIPAIAVMEAVAQGCSIIIHNDGRGDLECLPPDMPIIETNRYDTVSLAKTLRLHSDRKIKKSHAHFQRSHDIMNYYSARNVAKIIVSRLEQK
jgi:glycosyltransferase involved in cell wall biosynthesis